MHGESDISDETLIYDYRRFIAEQMKAKQELGADPGSATSTLACMHMS
jgi:hypothetical protein